MLRKSKDSQCKILLKKIYKNKSIYLMALPGLLLIILFKYVPMFGVVLAFKNFKANLGIFGSPNVGFNNFRFFFDTIEGLRSIKNTLVLNFVFIIVHTFFQILVALMLNEVIHMKIKKLVQTFMFFPFFISWIIVSVFAYNMFNYEFGSINSLLTSLGIEKIAIYNRAEIWPLILTVVDTWKHLGYGMIIYLAALAGISLSLYEAATVDGASKLQQIRFITIPLLVPTIIILLILRTGRIMNSDFGMFYGLVGDNAILYKTVDVLDTFVYRNLRELGNIGMAAAAGLFQSFIGLCLILLTNFLAKKYNEDSSLF